MGNNWFNFKQFGIRQEYSGMKVGTDSILLGAWVNTQNVRKLLDIGTGTGILALMMGQRSKAIIDAVEINKNACLEASNNIKSSPWEERIRIIESSFKDFYQAKKVTKSQYDLIILNPPYYSDSIPARTSERTQARHNSTLTTSELLKGVEVLLKPVGRLCLILPYTEGTKFVGEAKKAGLFLERLLQVKSNPNKPVHRLVMEFGRLPGKPEELELTIRNEDQGYTNEYVNLTKDFYLNF